MPTGVYIRSEETKQKIRLGSIGKHHFTAEMRKAVSLRKIGFKFSEESKRKISESLRGKKHSEETKKKMMKSQKQRVLEGRNPYFYKGGRMEDYPKLFQIRLTSEYKRVMQMTKERDDFRCLWCEERGGRLHSDHIYSFRDYPRLRLEPHNIQTLCVNCHKIKTIGDRTGKYIFSFPVVVAKALTIQ